MTTGIKWDAPKDPEEVKDYELSWVPLLVDGDELVSVVWTVVSPEVTTLAVDSSTIDVTNTISTIWLSGGEVGNASVHGHAVTAGGREYEQTMLLKIKEK